MVKFVEESGIIVCYSPLFLQNFPSGHLAVGLWSRLGCSRFDRPFALGTGLRSSSALALSPWIR